MTLILFLSLTNLNFILEFRVAAGGMAWKSETKDNNVTSLPASDIKWAQWLRVARGYQLRVGLKDRRRETFDGFEREVRFKQRITQRNTQKQ